MTLLSDFIGTKCVFFICPPLNAHSLDTRLLVAGDHVQHRRGDLCILSKKKNVILCRAERFIASLLIHRQIWLECGESPRFFRFVIPPSMLLHLQHTCSCVHTYSLSNKMFSLKKNKEKTERRPRPVWFVANFLSASRCSDVEVQAVFNKPANERSRDYSRQSL